jgi:uncharacterized repeat protein (TIGR03803 family)
VLYSFTGAADGGKPAAGVSLDSAGNLYGTTEDFGSGHFGVVYKVDPAGHETVLYSFTGRHGDGADPKAGVVLDSAGNLYGTTLYGGPGGNGIIYKLDPAAGHETVLCSFTGGADGGQPSGGVTWPPAGARHCKTRGDAKRILRDHVIPVIICERELPDGNWKDLLEGANPSAIHRK